MFSTEPSTVRAAGFFLALAGSASGSIESSTPRANYKISLAGFFYFAGFFAIFDA
jgi:hypothetical protein